MVIISDRLYVGASIEDVKKDVIKGLKKKQFQPGLYCITLPQEDGNILDIRRAATLRDYAVKAGKISLGLRFKKTTVDDIIVVGIALGRSEAIDVASQIVQDIYCNTNTFDTKNYFGYEV